MAALGVGIHRRDLIASVLGASAAAACSSKSVPLPPGEIAFAPERIGHRVRDFSGIPALPPARRIETDVAIVGSGVAGLSAAWRLARAKSGIRVELLELDGAPGGTARGGTSAVTSYPWGAHYVTAPMEDNRAFVTLLREAGVLGSDGVAEEMRVREPEERLFYKGRWYEGLYLRAGASPEDERQKRAFDQEIGRLAALRDGRGRRAFAIPLARSSTDPETTALDAVSMEAWLDSHGFTSPRLRWLVEYACRDDYGARMANVSAWAGLFYFASRLSAPGEHAQPVITWPEGNARLVAHLAKSGPVARTKLGVADVSPVADGVDLFALGESDADAMIVHAKRVILAVPRFIATRIVRPFRTAPPEPAGTFRTSAWMVANLSLGSRPEEDGFPLAWDNVLYDSPALGYVVATHQRGIDRGPSVWTYYHPLVDGDPKAARERLLQIDRDGWAAVTLADLGRAHPDLAARTTRLDVARWGHAMVTPSPGFVWSEARRRAAQPFGAIHFAHTDLSGIALFEEAFDHGVRAAEEVLAALGRGAESIR